MELKKQVEALLFACGRKISVEELTNLLPNVNQDLVKETLQTLQNEYNEKDSSLMITDEGELWKFTIREKYIDVVRKINPHTELSKTMMETLAVVAWKQPILQSEVIHIRTNKAYEHISELEKMSFLVKEKYGRTYMLKLTQKFFDYFDLRDANAARGLFREFKDEDMKEQQKKVEEFEKQEGENSEGAENKEVSKVDQEESEQVNDNNTNNNEENKMAEENLEYEHPDKEERLEKEIKGEEEETVYSETDRDKLVEDGEMTPAEDAFMDGYNKAEEEEDGSRQNEEE